MPSAVTTAAWFAAAANITAVKPRTSSFASRSTLRAASACTDLTSPEAAANISGVVPFSVAALGSAPPRVLDAADVSDALIGAHAMAVRGYPRFTVDVDLLTTDARVLDTATWVPLIEQGARVDRHRGDHEDPLAGVVRIVLADGTNVDVLADVGRGSNIASSRS